VNEKLLKSLQWYTNTLKTKYNVDDETIYNALAESLQQESVLEKLYMDACYIIENKN
jgi:hypothetical protein